MPSPGDKPAPAPMRTLPAVFPTSAKTQGSRDERPWHDHVNVDLILTVLYKSILHPFIAWLIPLCLRAQATPYSHTSFRVTAAYAALLTLGYVLAAVNRRLAHGLPREVNLAEEVVVITGGARGLGRLVADVYGLRGTSVAVLDQELPDDTEEGDARQVTYIRCDVADREQVIKARERIVKELGTPTVLINNAAVAPRGPLLDMAPEEVERALRVNIHSHYHTIQAFLPGMLAEDRGTIVTVSSVLAHVGAANLSTYAPAKAALHALHATLTAELRQNPNAANVRALLVAPGQMATPLFDGVATPSRFWAPVLAPVDVARELVQAVDDGRAGELALPLYARWTRWLGVLPVGLQRAVRWWAGVDGAAFAAGPASRGEKAEKRASGKK